MNRSTATLVLVLAAAGALALAAEEGEGTRHITGQGLDMYFMNDKVFGTAGGHPLWADYTCGKQIKGQIDVDGTYKSFEFSYLQEGDRKISGTFADTPMALGAIDKQDNGFVYHVFIGEHEHLFSIRYEQLEGQHMVNSVIEGSLPDGRTIRLAVDGRLCPMATTGIILITAGSTLHV
jgi:hypothetical protein